MIADREAIRAVNPQRHEMEQIDGIVYIDDAERIIIGFKDVRPDEFWIRGHMPGYPLLPGVLMCEAAAQLCSYYTVTRHLLQGDFIGFGGLEDVRFRAPVRPGDRLVLVGKATRYDRRRTVFNVQGFVGTTMVFHGDVIGVPLMRKQEASE
jgi:3-hydroxyacyl-[acyl-carrier-protein] dehydratase